MKFFLIPLITLCTFFMSLNVVKAQGDLELDEAEVDEAFAAEPVTEDAPPAISTTSTEDQQNAPVENSDIDKKVDKKKKSHQSKKKKAKVKKKKSSMKKKKKK